MPKKTCHITLNGRTYDDAIDQLMPGMQKGSILIETSTVNPATARQIADRLAEVGAGFVNAPVSGSVEGARKATSPDFAAPLSARKSQIA